MKHTESAASCANYCAGECDPAGTGCWHGSRATKAQTVKLYSASPTTNGQKATEGRGATGDKFIAWLQGAAGAIGCIGLFVLVVKVLMGNA